MGKKRISIYTLMIIGVFLIVVNGCKKDDDDNAITDIDGNVYTSITIGTQEWMVENLKVTRYNDGTAIPLVTNSAEWSKLTTDAYSWYDNNEATYKKTYGALYNWYAVNSGKLCPKGWHVPTDDEWTTLSDYLGKEGLAGGKLKDTSKIEAGGGLWHSPNTGATNEFGFSAIPGGGHYFNGNYGWIGHYGTYWSSTENSAANAWTRYMTYNSNSLIRDKYDKKCGYSIRCIKDK